MSKRLKESTWFDILETVFLVLLLAAWWHTILKRVHEAGEALTIEAVRRHSRKVFFTPWVLVPYLLVNSFVFWYVFGPRGKNLERGERYQLLVILSISALAFIYMLFWRRC